MTINDDNNKCESEIENIDKYDLVTLFTRIMKAVNGFVFNVLFITFLVVYCIYNRNEILCQH